MQCASLDGRVELIKPRAAAFGISGYLVAARFRPSPIVAMRVLAVLFAAVALVAAQQPSGAPTCSASCPATDGAGFSVHGAGTTAGGVLTCAYPAIAGENDSDFFCTYDAVRFSPSARARNALTGHRRPAR